MMLAISIITLSSIPLPASCYLFYLLAKRIAANDILLPSLQGEVEFSGAAECKTALGAFKISKVNFVVMAFGLLITKADKTRVILWRDSLAEANYRHLLVVLKREH
ncbi:hypothetical protein TW81_00270 [Vibrio galatheae]|uniref:Uncharacterized protein n=1 Tax=Vibrio galatheae TaxID=579748 RepID=A0A0F4NTR6_9VIBR|nr:hypothetical protein TW81_00270 [Vibrio galatheae]